tara:strand:+ start:422 stop:1675 length:1254 start_codon:yes stop_codon:yes gene_type:complete
MKTVEDSNYRICKNCFLCNSSNLTRVFKTNEIALTGVFPLSHEKDPIKTPITLNICNDCNNLQMEEVVNKELMFQDYWYRSGTTNSMKNHFNYLLSEIGEFNLGDSIFDIGCNDCTFLEIARKKGFDVYGVEPSVAFADRTIEDDSRIANDFFPTEKDWTLSKDKFNFITAISMFYDVREPLVFLSECKSRLETDGKLIIEVNYAKTFLERENVDMLGQEHLIYYFINTFETTLNNAGLNLNDAFKNEMNGGNIVFICSENKNKTDRLISLSKEEDDYLQGFIPEKFQPNVDHNFNRLTNKIIELLNNGKKLKIYGASTRGAFISQYLNLSKEHFISAVDVQLNKDGRRIPGTNIQIEMEDRAEIPDVYLVLPYQFLDEFIKKNHSFLKNGGSFLCFRPSFCEIKMDDNGAIQKEHY